MHAARATAAHDANHTVRPRWEHFEHRADIGVRGIGPSRAAAFEQAAMALTAVVTPLTGVVPSQRIELACEAGDDEALFVAWLNTLVYEMAVRRMLFSRYRVGLGPGRLLASAWGEPISVARHRPAVEVKGATFTALRVARCADGGWLAQTVLDV